MKNHSTPDEKSLAQNQTALPIPWSNPQLTATPLRDALAGGANKTDGTGTLGS